MTNEYTPPSLTDAAVNIYGSTISGSYAEALSPPNFRILSQKEGMTTWEIRGDDHRGRQSQADKLEKAYAGWASTTAERRWRGYLNLPMSVTSESQAFGGTAGRGGVYFTNYGSLHVVAQGTTANRCLGEDSTDYQVALANPYFGAAYSPGSAIAALMTGPMGGLTSRLLIGRTGATIDIHDTLGTSAATMHANLTFCCGGAITGTNAQYPGVPAWVFLANNGLWSISVNETVTNAPTQTWDDLPNGGCVLGNTFETLLNAPAGNRMYMLLPTTNLTTTAWDISTALATPAFTRLASANVDGTDVQYHEIESPGLIGGRLWRRYAVVFDPKNVIAYDGKNGNNLGIFDNFSTTSTSMYVVGIGGDDSHLRALVQNVSDLQWWEYNEASRGWLPVSGTFTSPSGVTVSDTPDYVIANRRIHYGPQLPYAKRTGNSYVSLYNSAEVTWARQHIPPLGLNPALAYQGSAIGSHDFAGSAVDTSPAWILPGRLAGHPFEITQIDARLMDLEAGGTDASAKFEVAVHTTTNQGLSFTNTPLVRTFSASEGVAARTYNPPAGTKLYRLQIRETLTQGTAVNKTPNGANWIIRGVSYTNE